MNQLQIILSRHLFTRVLLPSRTFSVSPSSNQKKKDPSLVVICGGGLLGTSVACHITSRWPRHVIVVDAFKFEDQDLKAKNYLNCAALSYLKCNPLEAALVKYTIDYYNLERRNSLYLASSYQKMDSMKRAIGSLKTVKSISSDVLPELISPETIRRKFDFVETKDLKAGVLVANDAIVGDVTKLRLRLRREAEKEGVLYYDGWQIKRVLTMAGKVVGVEIVNLRNGEINQVSCGYFVNCGGFWSREVGKLSHPSVRIPVLSVENQTLESCPEVDFPLDPVVYDCDQRIKLYKNPLSDSFLLSGIPFVSKPMIEQSLRDAQNRVRLGLFPKKLSTDWPSFSHVLSKAVKRFNFLPSISLKTLHNKPRGYSPDGRPVIGQSAEIENYFIASGVNLELSAGIGKLIADEITSSSTGNSEEVCLGGDYWTFDPKRFVTLHDHKSFLMDRLREVPVKSSYLTHLRAHYDDFETGHSLRVSPLYERYIEAGAVFIQVMGYERPALYYDPDCSEDEDLAKEFDSDSTRHRHKRLETPNLGRPHWFEIVRSEYETCRERVGLCDYTSFTKLELSSPSDQVVRFLQHLCSNDIDVPLGCIVHTGMQNERGGYENDCSLVRMDQNRFLLIGPSDQQTRALSWITRHLRDNSIRVEDITSQFTALALMGPNSKSVLRHLLSEPSQLDDFAFFTYKELDFLGMNSKIRACNLTHTGEVGFVLYIPTALTVEAYDALMKVGTPFGIKPIGSIAMRNLRIEKFYAFWGQDIDTTTTPLECGRAFRVKFDKDFLGKEALLKQQDEGIKRRYVQLLLTDFEQEEREMWPWGGEPIFVQGCKEPIGVTTTTGYGYSLKKHVCLGYVRCPDPMQTVTSDYVLKSNFEVEIGGERFAARANIHSPKLGDIGAGTYVATRQ